MERSRFVEHQGKMIFVMDSTNASPEEIHTLIDECARQVRSRPEQSVLTLTVAGGSKFDTETINKLKELTRGNAPYVKAAAVVGMTGLYKVVLTAVSMFSKRQFHMFESVEAAKDFLASQ